MNVLAVAWTRQAMEAIATTTKRLASVSIPHYSLDLKPDKYDWLCLGFEM